MPFMWPLCPIHQRATTRTDEISPTRPWSKINSDLFQLHGNNYLVMVDHYGYCIQLDSLSGKTSANSVIRAMRRQFARHGIPDELITDNGPQFESHEYFTFAQEYGFIIFKSSPYYSQGNGRAESAVKIPKNILKQSPQKDQTYLALLAYRNTFPLLLNHQNQWTFLREIGLIQVDIRII